MIMTFTDASLGNLNDGVGSTHGVIIWIIDGQWNCCPLFTNTEMLQYLYIVLLICKHFDKLMNFKVIKTSVPGRILGITRV